MAAAPLTVSTAAEGERGYAVIRKAPWLLIPLAVGLVIAAQRQDIARARHDLRDELTSNSGAHVRLKGIGCHVPGRGQSQNQNSESDYNYVSPDFLPRRDLSVPGHSPWPLKSARMLLAARSCWIQLSKRSLICC